MTENRADEQTLVQARTDALIAELAGQAGGGDAAEWSFASVLWAGVALSLTASLLVVGLTAGPRPNLSSLALEWAVQFKAAAMASTVGAGIALTRAAAIPGTQLRPFICLSPAVVLILCGVIFDRSGLSVTGVRFQSGPFCVGVVLLASSPPLALLLRVMTKRGTPTQPAAAGAAVGLLAGSLGALAYVVACVNDAAGFVAVWYGGAILLVAALGAALGRKILAW